MADKRPEASAADDSEAEDSEVESGGSDGDASVLASRLRLAVGQLTRRTRAAEGQPFTYYAVLGMLNRDGSMTTSDLAHAQFVRPQSMARTVAQLAEEDLVRFEPHPGDRRKTLVVLTDQGGDVLRTAMSRRTDWLRDLIESKLTPQEQRVLAAAVPVLERMASHG
jgi:DNA-binding MarR family transcriptional regulator